MKKHILPVLALLALSSCGYDNYDEPSSFLTGSVTYNDKAIKVGANENELELWQDGYELGDKIDVYINQDGTYSANLFDGEYKLTRLSGAPWEDNTDTIKITVKGNTVVDVPVAPYFLIDDANFTVSDNKITATFTVNQVSASAALGNVSLFLGANYLTDSNNHAAEITMNTADVTLGSSVTISIDIPEDLSSLGSFFARVGVSSDKSSRYAYSTSEKITL
ncbi:MAG: DUF3823 domain-containing protein [Mangrovibacterium sp.]